ncbi:MAG: hypothetical protein P4L40_06835 [Terracidiphilus sp.]|nr:hypothetical protein [Terracidiphilus sp.]
MRTFSSEREAKEYLIERIVDQANRVGESLTEIERKMLYFSETGWTLPDIMAVNDEFERTCDNDAYERKILSLAISARADDEAAGGDATGDWDAAVEKLSESDHYLLVLINPELVSASLTKRPPGDFRRLILMAVAVVAGLLFLVWIVHAVRDRFQF